MKKLLALAALFPAIAFATSPFDGTWKTRLDSMTFAGTPDNYVLGNGKYTCNSCVPKYTIKADGTDQPVPDHAYVDLESVKILSPAVAEITDKKDGKVISKMTMTVSADGSKVSVKFANYVGEKPVEGTFTEKRVSKGAAGEHALSGTWMQDAMPDMSPEAQLVKLESTPNGMKMTWNGQVTDAKFDGKEYPSVGDPGKTMVALKKVSDTQIEETDRRLGKVFDVIVWKLSADGKSISYEDTDPQHGTKSTWIAEKQH